MDQIPVGVLAALVGLLGGLLLGLAARLGQFCTLGAIESAIYGGDQKRLRMWGVTLGIAIFGTFLISALGLVDLSQTIYHTRQWNPFASIAGGLIFGYGMAYAGNCGFGALARFGGGDLRAMVVLVVMAVTGYMTIGGPLARLRVYLFPGGEASEAQSIAQLLSDITSLPQLVIASVISLGFVAWGLAYKDLRQAPHMLFWSAMAGLAIVSAWLGTAYVSDLSFGEVGLRGHTFTAPLGQTLIFLMTSSAGGLNFAVGSVVGVLGGAFIGSLFKGHFRWEACEDPRELGRQVLGAAMMGIGGVVALGCSVGQGLSAFSALAYSAPVTLACIVLGAYVGLRRLISGFQPS